MARLIQIFEHDTLMAGRRYPPSDVLFEESDLVRLQQFHQGEKRDYFFLLYRGIRFRQYVGVIQAGDLMIEILPKADRSSDDRSRWQSFLFRMLRRVYDLPLHNPDLASVRSVRHPIMDLFFESFLHETEVLIRQGLVRKYNRRIETSGALSGRLHVHRQVRENIVHQERFVMERSVFEREHPINQILYSTTRVISQLAVHPLIKEKANQTGLFFDGWSDRRWLEADFERIRLDRRTERYRRALELAKYILLNIHPDVRSGGSPMLALLFDMNILWEKYVVSELRRQLPSGWRVREQSSRKFWQGDASAAWLKPDILITSPEGRRIVWDTKWKIPKDDKPSEEDLRQIYAYLAYFDAEEGWLVYPSAGQTVRKGGGFQLPGVEKNAGMVMLSCEEEMIGLSGVLGSRNMPDPLTVDK